MMRCRNVVKISINQLNYNRFYNIRKLSNINDEFDNKILQHSIEGLNGLFFKFKTLLKIIFDEKELNIGMKLIDDGIVEKRINVFNLLISLQNPLIIKYKFDINEFYNGSKIALANVLKAPYDNQSNPVEYLKLNCHPEIVDKVTMLDNEIKNYPNIVFTMENYYIYSITTKIVGSNHSLFKYKIETIKVHSSNIDINNIYNSILSKVIETREWSTDNFPENSVVASIKVSGILVASIKLSGILVKPTESTDSTFNIKRLAFSAQFDGCLSKLDDIEWKIVDLEFSKE